WRKNPPPTREQHSAGDRQDGSFATSTRMGPMNGHRSLRFFTRALCWTPVLGFVLVGGCRDQEVTGPRAGEPPPPTDRTLAVAHVALEVDPASGAVRVLPLERARDRSGGPAFATVPVTGEHAAVQARCEGGGDPHRDKQGRAVTFT